MFKRTITKSYFYK